MQLAKCRRRKAHIQDLTAEDWGSIRRVPVFETLGGGVACPHSHLAIRDANALPCMKIIHETCPLKVHTIRMHKRRTDGSTNHQIVEHSIYCPQKEVSLIW